MLQSQILEPAYQQAIDPIDRIFAIISRYRDVLRATDVSWGGPIGNLAVEVRNNHPKLQRSIAENYQVLFATIEALIREASDRLPAEAHPATLARHVLAATEGGVMLARAYRDVDAFDQAVNPLRDYFGRLLRDRTESDEGKHEITKEKRARD